MLTMEQIVKLHYMAGTYEKMVLTCNMNVIPEGVEPIQFWIGEENGKDSLLFQIQHEANFLVILDKDQIMANDYWFYSCMKSSTSLFEHIGHRQGYCVLYEYYGWTLAFIEV